MTQRFFSGAGAGLLGRLRKLTQPPRLRLQIEIALLIGWVPLLVLGEVEQLLMKSREPLLFDISVHIRLLLAVPLFLAAKAAFAVQSGQMLSRLVDTGFVADPDRERFERLTRRTERLRDRRLPELLILMLSLLLGAATLIGWRSPMGMMLETPSTKIGAARLWFGLVSLPLFLFHFWSSVWRWAIWIWLLGSLARLRLQIEPGHPDRRGGLSFLALPSLAFHAPFLLAVSSVLCASWATQIQQAAARVQQFKGQFLSFVLLGELVAFGPLLLFAPRLFLAGRIGLHEYGDLATEYLRAFRRRWLSPGPHAGLLGTDDLQALADLGGSFRESVEKATALLFGVRDLAALLVLMLLPTLPLLLAEMPIEALLQKFGKLFLGTR